jgi:hypothetical protein
LASAVEPHDPERWKPVFRQDHAKLKPFARGFFRARCRRALRSPLRGGSSMKIMLQKKAAD